MSVFLESGLVILNGGLVATSSGCCCGGCLCSSINVSWSATATITDTIHFAGDCVILSFTATDSTTLFPDAGCGTSTGLAVCCLTCNADPCACDRGSRFCEAVFNFSSVGPNITTAAELAASFCLDACPDTCPFESDYNVSLSVPHTMVHGTNTYVDTFTDPGPGIVRTITLTTTVVCNP